MASLFTEFVRVSEEEIPSIDNFETNQGNSIWLRGLGDLELVGLWEILPGSQADGTLMADMLTEPDTVSVFMSVPNNFLECICNLDDAETPSILDRWRMMGELANCSKDQLGESLATLRDFAREAKAADEVVVQKFEL